jgi:hypothetical protein
MEDLCLFVIAMTPQLFGTVWFSATKLLHALMPHRGLIEASSFAWLQANKRSYVTYLTIKMLEQVKKRLLNWAMNK